MDPPRQLDLTADKVMRDLEEIRIAAVASGAFAPALRCVELQGRHIGLWRGDPVSERTLEQLITAVPPGAADTGEKDEA